MTISEFELASVPFNYCNYVWERLQQVCKGLIAAYSIIVICNWNIDYESYYITWDTPLAKDLIKYRAWLLETVFS